MKSPKNMRIIEIDITNACDKRCSNCTRLCGHQRRPFFMDFETFKRAVDSLDGYQGIRSMMGGEPTIHPEFERFAEYLGSKFPKRPNPLIRPQKNFINKVQEIEIGNFHLIDEGMPRMDIVGPGMFSNMGKTYKKYYEIISDILPFQGLNDHLNPVYHQSALITRKELGIPDDEWITIRDNCWLQNEWSAGITPKGCFFCEVAGVLDMLLDGPGGWPIEPGWWKRTPDQFGDQLHWCELCGFALDTFTRDSAEEVDDISPEWYERLKALKSPKLASGRANIIEIKDGKISEDSKRENKHFSASMPYIEHYEDRFNAYNSILFTHSYNMAEIESGDDFGRQLNKIIADAEDWILLKSSNIILSDDFADEIARYVLNPGTMHYIDLSKSSDTKFVKNADVENSGYVALFSKNASSLRKYGFDRIAQISNIKGLIDSWNRDKIIELSSEFDVDEAVNDKLKDIKYVIWGAGIAGGISIERIKKASGHICAVVDGNKTRLNEEFHGYKIQSPEKLISDIKDYDYLLVAHYTAFYEIKEEAIKIGVPEKNIQLISDLNSKISDGYC